MLKHSNKKSKNDFMPDIRHEMKFILDEVRLCEAEEWMQRATSCREVFQVRKVNSLYFDDPHYEALKDNLMGMPNREKLRLRWYSDTEGHGCISPKVEVKIREGRVGYKKTVPLEDSDTNLVEVNYQQLFAEICSRLPENHNLPLNKFFIPTLHVSYDRTYFEAPNGIRMTIDRNIKFYDPNQHQSPATAFAHNYNRIIMELKFPPELKNHVAGLLRRSNLTPQRHSKYVAGLAVFGRANYI